MKTNSPRAKESPPVPVAEVMALNGTPIVPVRQRRKSLETPANIPVLPIRNAVLFPGMVVPLTIGRSASRKLVEELKGGTIGVFTQITETEEEPHARDLHRVGVSGQVMRTIKQNADTVVII